LLLLPGHAWLCSAKPPEEWVQHVGVWSRILRARNSGSGDNAPPERNDEYAFYQLLLGAWPPELSTGEPPDPAETDAFRMRLEGAMVKAMREAKVHTTWAAPDAAYEDAVLAFIRHALDASRTNPFLESFASFEARLAPLGMRNSLVQAVFESDRSGCARHLSRCGDLGFQPCRPGQSSAGEFRAAARITRLAET
jgi:(1->4)-alpha-D-glucan 1-alpha-D-glucosylmutase